MTIHEALSAALTEAAAALAVPLFWQGEVFAPPLSPYLVAQVVVEQTGAASLGSAGLTRTDGALQVSCSTVGGKGDAEAVDLALRLSRLFPRGKSFDVDGGELVTMTPVEGPATSDGRRLAVPLKIPFYAMTFGG